MNAGSDNLVALEETGTTGEAESSTTGAEDQTATDGSGTSDSTGDPSTGGTSEVEVTNLDPVPYQTVTLDSGELRIVQQVTHGDILVSFCLLLVVAVQIGKWIWESVK